MSNGATTLSHAMVHPSRQRFSSRLLVIALVGAALAPASHAQPQQEAIDLWNHIVAQLPTPKDPPGNWPRGCADTPKEYAETRRIAFASPAVAELYRGKFEALKALHNWAFKWLHMPSDSMKTLCMDLRYAVARLQDAAGADPTGLLGERELAMLEAAVQRGKASASASIAESEKGLLTIFGIALGAPLRMADCPMPMQRIVQRPKFVPVTCKQKLGRPDEHVPTVTVYFSEADTPTWLGSIGQSNSLNLPNPSLKLDLSDWRVTGIHFESNYSSDAIAVDALTAKFGVKPSVNKPRGGTCLDFATGYIGECTATHHEVVWNVPDYIVRGQCDYWALRCRYLIQLASESAAQDARAKRDGAEQRERSLRSGRPL